MGTHIHTVVYTQLYMHMHSYTGAHTHKVATYVYAQLQLHNYKHHQITSYNQWHG